MSVKKNHPTFTEIRLDELRPNPCNPRKKFEGPEFEQFCDNIARVGVLQPILVRPIPIGETGIEYEIVFGERRFRAACKIAEKNGGMKKAVIPAQVKNLSDDDALDLMTVENLQREDLTPWEEAQGFQVYVDRFGEEKIPDLAERVNMDPRYIRRRLALLKLPEDVLAAWDAGKIQTGHLHQLLRLEDKRQIIEFLNDIVEHDMSVGDLKHEIDREAPPLKWAKFDLTGSGCTACHRNSEIQKKLFDIDCEKEAKCLNPKCFKQKQNDFFMKWKKTGFYKRYKTIGFRFREDVDYNKYNTFHAKEPEKCHACENYVTLLDLDGTSKYYTRTCIGDRKCFESAEASERKKEVKQTDPDQPRVTWHGTYFREKFFQAELPARIEQLTEMEALPFAPSIDVKEAEMKADRLVLMNLVSTNDELRDWFLLRHKLAEPDKWGNIYFDNDDLFAALLKIDDSLQLRREIRAAAAQGILTRKFFESTRRLVAEHIGIDLTREWYITEDYLQKKTKDEMMVMGEKLGIFADEKAQTYLFETLGKKRGKFTSCKKGELMDVFLKSGVELKGKVPEEILKCSDNNIPGVLEDDDDDVLCPECGVMQPEGDTCDECGCKLVFFPEEETTDHE